MGEHIYIGISKPAILVILVVTTLASYSQGMVQSQLRVNRGQDSHPVLRLPGGNRKGSYTSGGDGHGRNKLCCTTLRSQLLDFYAAVYEPYPELGFLLLNLESYTDWVGIETADIGSYKCLRVKDASENNFTDVGLVACDTTDQTQVVHITWGDYGIFLGTNENLSKCLTVDSGSLEENALVNEYQLQDETTISQQWKINQANTSDQLAFQLESTLSTGKCLTGHDDNMTLTTCGNPNDVYSVPKHQLWIMILSKARVRGQLQNRLLNKCLRAESDHPESDFAEIDFQACNSTDTAQIIELEWSINSPTPQAITFSTGKVLSVIGPSVSNHAQVKQMTKFYFANQVWLPGLKTDGWFRIRNVLAINPSFCLGVAANSSHLEMQLCGDASTAKGFDAVAQQVWTFIPNP